MTTLIMSAPSASETPSADQAPPSAPFPAPRSSLQTAGPAGRSQDPEGESPRSVVPWVIAPGHQWHPPGVLLGVIARIRAGEVVSVSQRRRALAFCERLAGTGTVVDYDPSIGFFFVSARPGVDTDLVRVPG